MRRVTGAGAAVILGCLAWAGVARAQQVAAITLAAGTKVELAVTAPVWAKTAKAGDPLYLQTTFPVAASERVAIPAGTYVQGTLLDVTRPTRKVKQAQLEVLFNKIIFTNGYAVGLPGAPAAGDVHSPAATAAKVAVQETTANDLLLDNGAQLEMKLAAPLALDAAQVAAAVPMTQPLALGNLRSATLCRPTEGSPGTTGTSDTVIPGTPGTPSTTIPGGPGMPDITIPGTPATPDTIIPGTPGTPGTAGTTCPSSPMVTASEPLLLAPEISAH